MTTLPGILAIMLLVQSQESLVFRGTIRVRQSATISADDVSHLAVVRLDELFSGPASLRAFVGKDITVYLQNPAQASDNEARIFTARPWLFGESVAVVELSSRPMPAAAAGRESVAVNLRRVQAAAADSALGARLDRAEVVVEGRVAAVRPTPRRTMVSEHDPQWTEAAIEVRSVIKGQAAGRLTIVFPASTDVIWYQVPKPRLGQIGVWLLSRDLAGATSRDQLGLATSGDFLAAAELTRVRRILRR